MNSIMAKWLKPAADKGEDFLNSLLDIDDGSRYLGEIGIGTNYNIKRFTRNILFDEKLAERYIQPLEIPLPKQVEIIDRYTFGYGLRYEKSRRNLCGR